MGTNFGKNLKELRKEKKLTQEKLSKIIGVSKTTICQWETEKQEPSLKDLVFLSNFFNVSTDYLLGLEDDLGNKIYNDFRFNQGTINNKF